MQKVIMNLDDKHKKWLILLAKYLNVVVTV